MTLIIRMLTVGFFATSLLACEMMQRHPSSGYSSFAGYGQDLDFFAKQENYARKQAQDEIEMERGYPLSSEEQNSIENRLALKRLESRLSTTSEKKQYYDYKPYLKTDQERMYFLNLPSVQARERYANGRGIASVRSGVSEKFADFIEEKDIAVGMNQKAVIESWGDPEIVEVAGNPVYGNERWKYSKYVSSEAGYKRQVRFVYFENGIVAGWESF